MLSDNSRQENDAEHSWHMALTALILFEYCTIEGVDINRVIRMILIHDLVEIYAGDTFAYDIEGNETKESREQVSATKLYSILPENQNIEYRELWEEFEKMETPDAIYASAIDRLQSLHNIHLSKGYTWKKHGITAKQIYTRMKPIKTTLPKLWEYVELVVKQGLKEGYIREVYSDDAI